MRPGTPLHPYPVLQASLVWAACALSVARALAFGPEIDDPFHYGEFFVSALGIAKGQQAFIPFTIHGAVDYLQSILFMKTLDRSTATFAIAFAPHVLTAIAIVFATLAGLRFAKLFNAPVIALLPFVVFLGAALSYRDTFLCISLFMLAALLSRPANAGPSRVYEVAFAAVCAFAVIWCFDRGIAGTVSIGLGLLGLWITNRRFGTAIIAFPVVLSVFFALIPGTSISHYVDNVRMLMATSAQWSYGWSRFAVILSALSIIAVLCVPCLGLAWLRSGRRTPEQIAAVGVLAVACVIFLKIGINRADAQHAAMAIWLPLLVAALTAPAISIFKASPARGRPAAAWVAICVLTLLAAMFLLPSTAYWLDGRLVVIANVALLASLVLLCLEPAAPALRRAALSVAFVSTVLTGFNAADMVRLDARQGQFQWLSSPTSAIDAANRFPPALVWAASELGKHRPLCLVDMTNNGLLNWMTDLPPCSRFSYFVYAGPQHEKGLIDDIRRPEVTALLSRSDFWSYAIDGKPMSSRFPDLDRAITASFPNETCNLGFCIRTR